MFVFIIENLIWFQISQENVHNAQTLGKREIVFESDYKREAQAIKISKTLLNCL